MSDEKPTPRMTKSLFMQGEQCSLALWRTEHAPDLREEPDDTALDLMEQGNEVQMFARHLYREGARAILWESMTHDEAAAETARAMEDPFVEVIWEATFLVDGRPFRVDMLRRDGLGGWEVVEIKASTHAKAHYIKDLAFQVHSLRKVTEVSGAYLCHLDGEYVYQGEGIDPWDLFKFVNLTQEVDDLQEEIETNIKRRREILQLPIAPKVDVGSHCNKPHQCPFYGACHDLLPRKEGVPNHISTLMYLREGTAKYAALKDAGIERIDEIPEDFQPALSKYQEIQWRALRTMEPQIDEDRLRDRLQVLAGGFHNWDIETAQYAIPRYAPSSPFEQIPQQWSNTRVAPDGTVSWSDFLADGVSDPRREFAESIVREFADDDLPIIVYSDFESNAISRLCDLYPDLAEDLTAIRARFVDLLKIVKECAYLPQYQGRYSEKYVLPAHVPGFDHSDLDIQNGAQCARWLRSLSNPDLDPTERRKIRNNCRVYNKRDTDGTFALTLALSPQVRELVAQKYPYLKREGVTADVVRKICGDRPAQRRVATI